MSSSWRVCWCRCWRLHPPKLHRLVPNGGRAAAPDRQMTTSLAADPFVAVVGAGPAGFYAAQQIIKRSPRCRVDLYERLPVPFGLVRFGVAPDHPEVKNVITTFSQTARAPGLRLLADVEVGRHVSIAELRSAYHAVVLAYGADGDRQLAVPGHELANVVSARQLVDWYNGTPDCCPPADLTGSTVAVVGMGNVALDVVRLLTAPPHSLRGTDITESALSTLAQSRVRHVTVVGRRGPLQAAFTIKELREQIQLQGVSPVWDTYPYHQLESQLSELMVKSARNPRPTEKRTWSLKFLRTPLEALGSGSVESLRVGVNALDGDRVVDTGETELIPCQLLVTSIGYRGRPIDPDLPFDSARGVIPNTGGRVHGLAGVYATGWIGTGPVGVIINTMTNSFSVGKHVADDLAAGAAGSPDQHPDQLVHTIRQRGARPVGFDDWLRLDAVEVERGRRVDKPREKVVSIEEMRRLIWA